MSATSPDQKPLLFVSVGTDHHPFDRLVSWVDAWLGGGGKDRVRPLVQFGRSAPPQHADAAEFLDHDSMRAALGEAAVVVCHGGPGTIMMAASGGLRPIVVPRRQSLGEHVDDHQVAFTRRMVEDGTIELAESQEHLHELLDERLSHRGQRVSHRAEHVQETVNRFASLVDQVVPDKSPDANERPTRVLYIAGMGRSGSTLLDLMLGQLPGLLPVGELRHIWKRGVGQNQLCGCGTPFRACPFWTAVGQEAFGGWDKLDVEEMVELERRVDRHRFLPFLALPGLWPAYDKRLRRYRAVLSKLYRAIESAGDGRVVVDSTKDPPFGFLLRDAPGIDLRVVHLVRDARGVSYSWTKKVRKPERVDTVELMDMYSPAGMSLRWFVYNGLVHALERLGVPRLLVRYESLVQSPERELQRIVDAAGEEFKPEDLHFLKSDAVEIDVHHTVAGNPMRFAQGRIRLSVDQEWKTKLSRRNRTLITVLAWPLMRHYGYVGRRAAGR